MASENPFMRVTRNVPRRNYHALNNGRSTPFQAQSEAEIPEPEAQSFDTESNPSGSPGPFEPTSQPPSSSPSPPSILEASVSSDTTSVLYGPEPTERRKEKSHSSWTLQHFWVTVLDTRWSRKGGPLRNDRLLICKRCSWSSTDSARHGSTSNLSTHLQSRHRIKAGSVVPLADNAVPTLDQFVRPQVDLEQAIIQWVVQTRQPFTVVEHPAFKAIFHAVKADLPIKSADTLYNRVGKKFIHGRDHLKQELGANCRTIALSLDVWTSEHQLAILGVIGHWITPGFDRREELLEFTEIQGPHSGENLAEIVLTMLDELEIAPKLLTITADNAGNNGTLCEALQSELLKTYDDKDDPFRMKPLMRFRGRESFIPCLAHVINLICKEILVTLKAGSIREAKALLDEVATQRELSFASTHTTKSAVVKTRLLTLWIARSPQRRQEWKRVSPDKQVRYDVDNRWNSTYLMIADAVRLRRELTQFVRTHADVQAFQLTEHDWLTLQQLGNVLKPFWDHTNMVSKACPTIVESLPIYWHLDDLLDDIQGAGGDFEGVNGDIRAAVEGGIRKMNKFARLMDDNILYYVAAVLDPRIKTSLIQAQMSEPDAQLIISQVREFLKKQYPFVPALPSTPDRPRGMPETIWRTLQKVQPPHGALMSDIDRYLGSQPVNWSHHLIEDGDSAWVLKWWKMNASEFPLMAQAVRDYSPVPSAEVGVERLFSDARDVLGLRRHRMNAETMRRLMLLKGHYDKKSSD